MTIFKGHRILSWDSEKYLRRWSCFKVEYYIPWMNEFLIPTFPSIENPLSHSYIIYFGFHWRWNFVFHLFVFRQISNLNNKLVKAIMLPATSVVAFYSSILGSKCKILSLDDLTEYIRVMIKSIINKRPEEWLEYFLIFRLLTISDWLITLAFNK